MFPWLILLILLAFAAFATFWVSKKIWLWLLCLAKHVPNVHTAPRGTGGARRLFCSRIIIVALLAGIAALWFRFAFPPVPSKDFSGQAAVQITPEPDEVTIKLSYEPSDSGSEIAQYSVRAQYDKPPSGCAYYELQLRGDAQLITKQPHATTSMEDIEGKREPVQVFKGKICPDISFNQILALGQEKTPMISQSGYIKAVMGPKIKWLSNREREWPAPISSPNSDETITTIHALWDLGDLEPSMKPDGPSKMYIGPGLQWAANVNKWDYSTEPPQGFFVDAEGERAATQWVFWSGLLASLAVAYLLWILEQYELI